MTALDGQEASEVSMRRVRLILAMVIAISAVGMIATSAAAADPRLTMVNGAPDKKVDVCIGSKEIKSKLSYGGSATRTVAPGSRNVRFHKAAGGKCTGALIAKKNVTLAADEHSTIVLSARKPNRVMVFANPDHPAQTDPVVVRNASDVGDLEIRYVLDQPGTIWFVVPAAGPVFLKGEEGWGNLSGFNDWLIWGTRPGDNHTVIPAVRTVFDVAGLYQYVAVGTTPKNARFVVILRDQ
jgi:hypothetical protein